MRKNSSYLVILLLVSGRVSLCSLIHREYYLISLNMNWDEAQVHCREKYSDLAVIGDHEDMKRVINLVRVNQLMGAQLWFGLKKDNVAVWLWSIGDPKSGHGLVHEYTNWASSPESSHHCGGMRHDGKWRSALCQSEHPFVCQGYDGSSGMYVVHEQKTWRAAQEHCRLKNGDLASARNQNENQKIQKIIKENLSEPTSAWIGLSRDQWSWSDQSQISYRYWSPSQPDQTESCVMYNQHDHKWYTTPCSRMMYFICYERIYKRQIVKVEMKSDAFFHFKDFAMRAVILKQIPQQNVNLEWRIQPDGMVFHQKEIIKNINDVCEDKE